MDRRDFLGQSMGVLACLAGCGRDPESGTSQDPVVESRPAPPPHAEEPVVPVPDEPETAISDAELERWLSRYTVGPDDWWRHRILYTWTTDAQTEPIRRGEAILTRSQHESGAVSAFDARLVDLGRSNRTLRPMARLFRYTGLRNRRFAWTAPWATMNGPNGSAPGYYGPVLMQMVMKEDSWNGFFDGERLEFRDAAGEEVDQAQVLAHPQRIGAICHRDLSGLRPFREFVICNESAIQSVAFGTDSIRSMIEESASILSEIAERPILLETFRATRALHLAYSRVDIARDMARGLRALRQPSPYEREVTATFNLGRIPAARARPIRRTDHGRWHDDTLRMMR